MKIRIFDTKSMVGRAAAVATAKILRKAVNQRGAANLLLATGVSQFELLANLVNAPNVDWKTVTGFHLDEYLGIPPDHKGSLRRYLEERFALQLPSRLAHFHQIKGESTDPQTECRRLAQVILGSRIDVGCIGIGENGHIAFNDPPADFETDEPFLIVQLDEASRRQQLGEGWFDRMEEVPDRAITMSVRQIMKCESLIVVVPELRKAHAVAAALNGPITPDVPASILQRHPDCEIYLDQDSAAYLDKRNQNPTGGRSSLPLF